jgi:hypothetical protein
LAASGRRIFSKEIPGTIPLTAVLPSVLLHVQGQSQSAPQIIASESMYTVCEFDREVPNDAACLKYLVDTLYPDGIFCPKRQKVTKHHRGQPSLVCL